MARPTRTTATVIVHGASEFRRDLRVVDASLPRTMRAANLVAAEVVVLEAKRRAPVLTGRLRESIKAGATQSAGYVRAGTNARIPYAPVIEFGWPLRNIAPQPFIYPAIEDRGEEVIEVYGAAVENVSKLAFPDSF